MNYINLCVFASFATLRLIQKRKRINFNAKDAKTQRRKVFLTKRY